MYQDRSQSLPLVVCRNLTITSIDGVDAVVQVSNKFMLVKFPITFSKVLKILVLGLKTSCPMVDKWSKSTGLSLITITHAHLRYIHEE